MVRESGVDNFSKILEMAWLIAITLSFFCLGNEESVFYSSIVGAVAI